MCFGMSMTYLEQLQDYARWWRTTSSEQRQQQAPSRIARARAMSLWYGDLGLDPGTPVPEQAPCVTRAMLQRHPGAFVADTEAMATGGYIGRTSGSTGEPVEVMMCAWALAHYYMHQEWMFALLGEPLPERCRQAYVSVGTHASSHLEGAPLWQGQVARFDEPSPEKMHARLRSFKPHVVSASPGDLLTLWRAGHASAWPGVRHVVMTSEHVTPRLYEELESLRPNKNIVLLNSYGLSEVGPVAWRCPEHGARDDAPWHVPAGSGYVERLNGELVVTTWRNRAMPLTRYATGDGVERVSARHHCEACGHVGQSFWGLMGRAHQPLCDVHGERVSPVQWIRVLNDPEHRVSRHRIRQTGHGELEIHCEMPETRRAGLLARLESVHPAVRVRLIDM